MDILDNDSKKSSGRGGVREGAGRPKGTRNKLNILDFFKGGEITELVEQAIRIAKEDKGSKERLFLLEQIFGKAKQAIEVSGEDGLPFTIQIIKDGGENKNS